MTTETTTETKAPTITSDPTAVTYGALDRAYEHFNATLYGGRLPRCLITLNRKKGAGGYFSGDRFASRDGGFITDEIALNPQHFANASQIWIISVLVHEMSHLWVHHFGKRSRGGYHNACWADDMERIGLYPSSTFKPGGKRIGQRVGHYIIEGGPFDVACHTFLAAETEDLLVDVRVDPNAKKKRESKTKFTCHGCYANAWAKPDAKLICGACKTIMCAPGTLPDNLNGRLVVRQAA